VSLNADCRRKKKGIARSKKAVGHYEKGGGKRRVLPPSAAGGGEFNEPFRGVIRCGLVAGKWGKIFKAAATGGRSCGSISGGEKMAFVKKKGSAFWGPYVNESRENNSPLQKERRSLGWNKTFNAQVGGKKKSSRGRDESPTRTKGNCGGGPSPTSGNHDTINTNVRSSKGGGCALLTTQEKRGSLTENPPL